MAKNVLPVDFQDDILTEDMDGRRRYQMITNADGTVSFVDVTEYTQVGSNFGQAQINATNEAVNESADKNKIIDTKADLMANAQAGMIAGAMAVKEAVSELNENKANKDHSHAWSAITGKPSSFTPASHTHDDRYYTESETNTKLGAKLDKSLIKKGTITTSTPNWVNLKLQTADRILLSAYVVSGPNTNCECRICYNNDAKGYIIVIKDLNGNNITSGTYKIEYKYIELYL